ncbi:unnamed protein product, partial [Prorocentrum cordatum]
RRLGGKGGGQGGSGSRPLSGTARPARETPHCSTLAPPPPKKKPGAAPGRRGGEGAGAREGPRRVAPKEGAGRRDYADSLRLRVLVPPDRAGAGRASRGRNRRRRAPAGRRGRGGGAHRQAGLADKDRQGVEAELPTGRLAWPMKNEQVIDAQSALLRLMSAEPPQAALALPERL